MLSPRSYRASLLDLLTSPTAALHKIEDGENGMQVHHTHGDPAQTLDPYNPSLQLSRTSTSPIAEKGHRVASNARRESCALAPADVPLDRSCRPAAPWSRTASAGNCVIEDSVISGGSPQFRGCNSLGYAPSASYKGLALPSDSDVTVAEEERRSVILSFIDNCICAGVPEVVIAEQVQLMASSMKESLALHAALHAQRHKDRIRTYELSELTAMLKRQQLQFTQAQQQQVASAVPSSSPVLPSSSQIPPSLLSPGRPSPQSPYPRVRLADESLMSVKPLHYKSISQRLPNDARLTHRSIDTNLEHPAGSGRPSLLSGSAAHQRPENVHGATGISQTVPLSSWRARPLSYSSATETPPERVVRSEKNRCSGAAAVSGSTGPAHSHRCTRATLLRQAATPRGSSRVRNVSRRDYRRHMVHQKLCDVCYPSSPSKQLSLAYAAQEEAVRTHPFDGRPLEQQGGSTSQWQQQHRSLHHYMKPTHASIARRETKSRLSSPLLNTPSEVGHSPRSEGYEGLSTLQRLSSITSSLDARGGASALASHPAIPQKLLVRATHSSRLRVSAASQRQKTSCSNPHDKAKVEALEAARMRSGGGAVLNFEQSDDAIRPRDPTSPKAQRSLAPRAPVVTDGSLPITPVQTSASGLRVGPQSSASGLFYFPGKSGVLDTRPRKSRLSVDTDQPINTLVTTTASTSREVEEEAMVDMPTRSAATLQVLEQSQSGRETVRGGQFSNQQQQQQQQQQERVPERRPPCPPSPPREPSSYRDERAALRAAMPDDDYGDPIVPLTSPELQLFMELSQRKLRETERVLAHTPTPSRIVTAHHHTRPSSSPISVINTSHLHALKNTAAPSVTHFPSVIVQQTSSLPSNDLSGTSVDTVAVQQQQRLAELHRRLSNYGNDLNHTVASTNGALSVPTTALTSPPSTVMTGIPPETGECSSDIFQPHVALSAPFETSPLLQISPTSSDEDGSQGARRSITMW